MNSTHTKAFLSSVLVTGIIFSLLPLFFVRLGLLFLRNEFLLLSFVVVALGLSLYGYLNSRFPNKDLEKFSLSVSNLLLGICVAFLFFGYLKWYTVVIFSTSFVLFVFIEYVNKLRFMYQFYRVYILLLIPFYFVCLLIKDKQMLKFDENATLKLKLAGVSIEAYFYFMALLLAGVYLFEFFKDKMTKANG